MFIVPASTTLPRNRSSPHLLGPWSPGPQLLSRRRDFRNCPGPSSRLKISSTVGAIWGLLAAHSPIGAVTQILCVTCRDCVPPEPYGGLQAPSSLPTTTQRSCTVPTRPPAWLRALLPVHCYVLHPTPTQPWGLFHSPRASLNLQLPCPLRFHPLRRSNLQDWILPTSTSNWRIWGICWWLSTTCSSRRWMERQLWLPHRPWYLSTVDQGMSLMGPEGFLPLPAEVALSIRTGEPRDVTGNYPGAAPHAATIVLPLASIVGLPLMSHGVAVSQVMGICPVRNCSSTVAQVWANISPAETVATDNPVLPKTLVTTGMSPPYLWQA